MPEKIREATTLTWPRPPFHRPTRTWAKLKIFSVTLLLFMILAARMNRGTASKMKLLNILLQKISAMMLGSIPVSSK